MSDNGQELSEIIQRMFARRTKSPLTKSGFVAEQLEIKVKDGLEAGLISEEIFRTLVDTCPNGIVKRMSAGWSDADVFLTTVDGQDYIVKVTHGWKIESEGDLELTKKAVMQPKISRPRPPLNAEFILHLLLKSEEQDAVIGDLLERYVKKHKRLGKSRADIWFYIEVGRSLWPLAKRSAAKAIKIAVVGEWIRRMIH